MYKQMLKHYFGPKDFLFLRWIALFRRCHVLGIDLHRYNTKEGLNVFDIISDPFPQEILSHPSNLIISSMQLVDKAIVAAFLDFELNSKFTRNTVQSENQITATNW